MTNLETEEARVGEFSNWVEFRAHDHSCAVRMSDSLEATTVFGMFSRVRCGFPYYRSGDNHWVRTLTCPMQSPEYQKSDNTTHSHCPWRGIALISGAELPYDVYHNSKGLARNMREMPQLKHTVYRISRDDIQLSASLETRPWFEYNGHLHLIEGHLELLPYRVRDLVMKDLLRSKDLSLSRTAAATKLALASSYSRAKFWSPETLEAYVVMCSQLNNSNGHVDEPNDSERTLTKKAKKS